MPVYDCSDLSNTEKLVYLQQAVKNDSAKNTIEGLSHFRDHHLEKKEKTGFALPFILNAKR